MKPIYQVSTPPYFWQDVSKSKYENAMRDLEIDGRILYPAAAYEALQKENNSLKLGYKAKEFLLQEAQKEVAKLRSFDADNKGLKECNSILTAENEALRKQAQRYEKLRKQNAQQFAEIYKMNIQNQAHFDDIIDNLPFKRY